MASNDEDTASNLKQRWMKLTIGIDENICMKWWNIINSKYSEPARKYHTLFHLQNMFHHMDSHISDIKHEAAMSYSIFFHDLEYDVHSQNNEEESIKLFQNFSKESDLDQNNDLTSKVEEIIMLSKAHCTEEHKSEGVYGKDDIHYFLDFDVSILGTASTEYKTYSRQIQEEYNYLPASKYNFLRIKVLQLFLQIPNIYATKSFRDRLEQQARTNIQKEIDWLKDAAVKA